MHPGRENGGRQWGLSGWRAIERCFDAAFGPALNPLRHLGAIGLLALALLAGSGVLLYALFDTSVDGAYRSVSGLRDLPWGAGSLLRGMHRHAADLLAIAVSLHIVREWLHGHAHGARRFHWLTGVPLPILCFVSAIGGFWLAWDALAQYSALATAEWLDALPLFTTPLARNFLTARAVSDRLFSLLIFVHVGVPLLLLFGLWFHLQRLAHVSVLPPRALTLGIVGTLAALSLVQPVLSHAPAALDRMPSDLHLDWLLLWLHPLTDATSRGFTWALLGGTAALLLAWPFLSRPVRAAVAAVDPHNCSGCRRCFDDCPYAAIRMVAHPNGRAGSLLAQVDADLCTSCGICAGACPSSTPFRGAATLHTGIDMPQRPIDALRRELHAGLHADPQAASAARPMVVYTCDHGAHDAVLTDADAQVHRLLCAGQLPPAFVEYALRNGAQGVLIATCRTGGCAFRLGERWTAQRLDGRREPHLRAHVPRTRIELVQAGPGDEHALIAALQRLRERTGTTCTPAPQTQTRNDENLQPNRDS